MAGAGGAAALVARPAALERGGRVRREAHGPAVERREELDGQHDSRATGAAVRTRRQAEHARKRPIDGTARRPPEDGVREETGGRRRGGSRRVERCGDGVVCRQTERAG